MGMKVNVQETIGEKDGKEKRVKGEKMRALKQQSTDQKEVRSKKTDFLVAREKEQTSKTQAATFARQQRERRQKALAARGSGSGNRCGKLPTLEAREVCSKQHAKVLEQ